MAQRNLKWARQRSYYILQVCSNPDIVLLSDCVIKKQLSRQIYQGYRFFHMTIYIAVLKSSNARD